MDSIEGVLEWIFDGLSYVLGYIVGVIGVVLSGIFVTFANVILEFLTGAYSGLSLFGSTIINSIFSYLRFDSLVFSNDFFYFFVGLLFGVFALKLLWHLITSIISAILS